MEAEEIRIDYEKLKKRFSEIPESSDFLKEKALLCTVYGAMARIGEVVRGRYSGSASIKRSQITLSPKHPQHVIIMIRTEKVGLWRRVPVNKIKETWLVRPILLYSAQFATDEELFPYTTRWAEKVFQKHFPEYGQHIHLLRKWRATHLISGDATGKPVPINIVARMGGWTKLDTLARVYALLTVEDYIETI